MPTYDYRCAGGHRYEKREPFGSPAAHPCDRCGKTAKRMIHVPTVVFKGSGWYKTDSRSKSRKRDSGSDSEKSDKKKEAKTAPAEGSSSSSSGSDAPASSNGSKPE